MRSLSYNSLPNSQFASVFPGLRSSRDRRIFSAVLVSPSSPNLTDSANWLAASDGTDSSLKQSDHDKVPLVFFQNGDSKKRFLYYLNHSNFSRWANSALHSKLSQLACWEKRVWSALPEVVHIECLGRARRSSGIESSTDFDQVLVAFVRPCILVLSYIIVMLFERLWLSCLFRLQKLICVQNQGRVKEYDVHNWSRAGPISSRVLVLVFFTFQYADCK